VAQRLTVWGSSRVPWLRPLARRPWTTVAYAAPGLGLMAATILTGGGLPWLGLTALAVPVIPGKFVYLRDRAGREARASRRAARALSRIDGTLDATAGPDARPDEAGAMAARSEAVLSAYRELLGPGAGGGLRS
jgi:hypothetical protein